VQSSSSSGTTAQSSLAQTANSGSSILNIANPFCTKYKNNICDGCSAGYLDPTFTCISTRTFCNTWEDNVCSKCNSGILLLFEG
jgi:hypothetical protein